MTTVYLLLTVLAGPDTTHEGRLRYQSRPRATEALRRLSTAGANLHGIGDEDTGIHTGYNVIRQFIDQHIPQRDTFAHFLRSQVTMVRVTLPPETDLNRYFEIMNTRGQQLQQVDIVKARLMSHLDNDAERACFAWIWDACADMESYVQMSLTRGKPELRTQLFGDKWSWLTATSFKDLQAHRDAPPDAGNTSDALDESSPANDGGEFLTLEGALRKYAISGAPDVGEDEENVRFRSTIDFPAFLLHVLKIVKGETDELAGLDDKRLVEEFEELLDALPKQDAAEWCRVFAFKLLRCRNLFDSFILKRQYTTMHSDDGDWSLQRLIKRDSKNQGTPGYVNTFRTDSKEVEEDGVVDRKTNDLLLIQSMLRVTFTSARTMHWITMLLASVEGQDPGNIDEAKLVELKLVELLRNYARDKVKKAFPFDEQPVGFSINRIVFTYLDYLLLSA